MQVKITGIHIDVGDALRQYATDKMAEIQDKYFSNVVDFTVNLSIEGHRHIAEVTSTASGIVVRARAEGADLYAAIDAAQEKLSAQLLKYKGRLQKHRRRRKEASARLEQLREIATVTHVVDEAALDEAPEDIFAEYMPKIVHKDVRKIPVLSVDEAVMQMDLLHMNFFIFQNPNTHDFNVVFRQDDGKVAWVEPQRQAVAKSA
jgi:putative sigma-54 modulation protein